MPRKEMGKLRLERLRDFVRNGPRMKKHAILLGCALALLWVPASAEEHTPLGEQMDAVDDGYKGFRRETDPVKGAKEARAAQMATLKATAEIPELIKEMPDGPEKDKAANAYRIAMGKLFLQFCEVEKAFLNGEIEAVDSIVDELKKMKKTGHQEFMKEEE